MSPSHTTKAGRRYRYYVSQTDGAAEHPAWRVGAHEIERVVCDAIGTALDGQLHQRLDQGDLSNDAIARLRGAIDEAKRTLADNATIELRDLLARIVRRIDVADDAIVTECSWACIDPSLSDASDPITSTLPLGCVRTRKQQRMLIATDDKCAADPATVRLIARAFAARKALLEQPSIEAAASSLGYSRDYTIALARLSYLAPDLVIGIVDGSVSGVTSKGPLTRVLLPSDWAEQRAMLTPI
jgi:site-specific DNA recombinase